MAETWSELLSFWQETFVIPTYIFTGLIYAGVLGPVSGFKAENVLQQVKLLVDLANK